MKSILTSLKVHLLALAALLLTGSAWAVPVQIWNGDFTVNSDGTACTKVVGGITYTLTLNGNEVREGEGGKKYIEITNSDAGSLGVSVERSSNTAGNGGTVLVKYSNLVSTGNEPNVILASLYENTRTESGYPQIAGLQLSNAQGTPSIFWAEGYWNNKEKNGGDGSALTMGADTTGYLAFSYSTGGSIAYRGTENGVWSQIFVQSGSVGKDTYGIKGFGVGGLYAELGRTGTFKNNARPATGMKIHAIAFSDAGTTDVAGMGGFEFTENAAKINGQGYATVAEAIAAAQETDEIEILRNSDEALTLSRNVILTVAEGKSFTLSGAISGDYNVTKKGLGTLAIKHNVAAANILDIAEGTLKYQPAASNGFKGTLNVHHGATYVNMLSADVWAWNYSGVKLNIHGTFDMGSTRANINNGQTWNIYGGATITCASNNTRCFDFADQGNPTFNFLAHTEGDSDVITFDVQGSYRTKDPTFNIAEGVTVVVTKTQDLWSDSHTITKSGIGTLKFAASGKVNNASIALNVTAGHLDLTDLAGTAAENIKGNLSIANGVTLHLPKTLAEGVAYPLCAGTLTPPTTVQDVTVYVGDVLKTVNLTFDTTAKTVSYDIYRETLQSWSAGTIIFDGDLHLLVKNADGTYTKTIDGVTYTINLNGHELVKEGSHSYILIKEDANADQLGVTVSRAATSETGLTMVMKYSDFGYVDAAKSIPFTISCSSYDNVVAPFIDSEDGVMKTYWANFHQGTEYASTAASKFDSSIDTGYLALSYGSSGTRVFQKGEDAWTEVYKNGDVKGTGTYNIKGVSVGGLFSKKTGNAAVIADGMKIYSLAVTTTPIYDNNSEDLAKLAFAGDDLVYNAFLTETAVDTGWVVESLDDLLGYTFYGTMDGGNISGSNVDSRGFHVVKDGESVVFQMQVRQNQGSNNDHVKAVKVRLTLDANKHVLIEGAGAGHVSNLYLGTNITSWGDTFVSDANTAGYGVNKVVATKKPVPFASVGFDGDTWTSSAITDDHASGRVNSNFMNENGTDAASNFVSVRESSADKAVKIADNVRPSYKNDPNLTFSKAVKGDASWTVQAVAKMVPQDGKRLAVWGIGETSYQGSGDRGIVLLLNTDGRPQFCKYGNKTTTDIIAATDGDSLYDDRYHVYTIVCSKNTVSDRYSLYVDGELVASSGSAALATIPTSNQYFEVGTVRGGAEQLPSTNKSIGSFFDDVAAWNVALTAAEVKANAKKFPVWPIYIAREWQGADGETITTPANWGAAEAFDFGKTTGVFPDATKSVTLVGETKFGTIEINGAYTFRGTGTIATSTLDFGANGSLRLEAGTTLKFTGSFDKALLSKITFAGGKVAFKNVPSFTQSDNINVDTNLAVGSYKMLEWTDFAAVGAFGYGLPMLNNSALNPTATVTNHGTATVQEVEFTNGKARLLGLVGGVYLEIRDEARLNRTALKILPLGDSITEGYNSSANCANYRTQLAAKLSMDGYNVQMLGYHYVRSRMPSGEWAPLEWQMHAGVSAQRVWTRTAGGNSNARAGDMEAVEATLNMVGGEPDVVLFKLGTNDIGVGDTAEHIFLGFKNTIKYLHEKLPNASIITTTCVKYGKNDSVRQSYNTMIRNWFANGEAPAGVYLVDQCKNVGDGSEAGSFNDAQGRPLFYSDSTHPDWAGHDLMSDGWLDKIEELYNTDARKKSGDYVEVVPETYELGAEHNVQSSYLEGFTHMSTLNVKDVACYPQTAFDSYDWKNTTDVFSSIEKVGYYVELVRRDTGAHKFVWVDMDAFGSTLDEVGLPTTATKQQKVTSLHVYSNMDSVHNVAANDDTVNGYIEFSPYNSTATARSGDGVPSQLWSAMDWNDTFATSGAGRGAMQVHRVKKDGDELWNAAEVVFAYNNWGSANNGATGTDAGEIGIGNFAQHYMGDTSYGNANGHEINARYGNGTINIDDNNCSVDYTSTRFSPVGDMVNAKAYSVKNIEIWVKGTVPQVAQIGSDIYPTLEAALDAASGATAEQPVTITLLKACAETDLVIPANVTVKTSSTNQFTGTVASGAGRIVFEGYLPTKNQQTANSFTNGATWAGTVELKSINIPTSDAGIIQFVNYANASSTLCFNGVTSTMYTGKNYEATQFAIGTLEIGPDGWTSAPASTNYKFSVDPTYACKLTGTGKITVHQIADGNHAVNFIGDMSEFEGSIELASDTTFGMVFQPAGSTAKAIPAKTIEVASGISMNLPSTATWTAANGINVSGTIAGAGNFDGTVTLMSTTASVSATNVTSVESGVSQKGVRGVTEGGVTTYTLVDAVAQIGYEVYTTIEEAINAATVDQVVKILISIGDGRDLDIPANKTIDIGSNSVAGAIIIGLGSKVIVSGNRTTNGIIGPGTLVVKSGTITAKNQAGGYAVDGATIQTDGGTFNINSGTDGAFDTAQSDPTIRNATFVLGENGTLTNYGWVNMVGAIEFYSDATSEKNAFNGGSAVRGTPDIIKSGSGTVKFNINQTGSYKLASLTINDGVLKLNQAAVVGNTTALVSGKKHHEVVASDDGLTYSLAMKLALHATIEGDAAWNDLKWKDDDEETTTWVNGAIAKLTVVGTQQLAIPATQGFAADEIILQGEGSITLAYDAASPAVPVDAKAFDGSLKVTSDQALTIEAGEKTVTFSCSEGTEVAPTITCGTLVKEGEGTLILGEYRPTTIDVKAGKIELTLTDDERVAGEISFTAPAGLTAEQARAYAEKVIVKTHTGKFMTEKTTSLVGGKLVISFEPPKVASYNGTEYSTLEAAMNAAIEHQTTEYKAVELLDSVYHAVEIPAGVVVKTSAACRFKGAVTGQGEIMFQGYVPSGEELIASLRKGATWQGSVVLKDIDTAQIEDQHKIIRFNTLGNTHSRIVIDNVTSTMYAGTVDYPNTSVGEIYIADGGWTSTDLTFNNNSPSYTCKLTGTGAITVNQKGAGTIQFIGDASEFRGSLVMGDGTGKGLILKKEHCTHTAGAKQIVVDTGKTMTIPAGKVWEARGGITIEGIVTGGGRLVGNVTFEPHSELEVTEMNTILHCEDVVIFKEHMVVHIPEVAEDVKVLEAEEMNLMNEAGEVVDSISFEVHSETDDEKVHHDHYIFHFSDGFVRVTEDIDATLAGIGYNTLVEALASANAHGLDPQDIIIHNQSLTDANIPDEYKSAYQIKTVDGKKKIVQNENVVVVFLDANGGLFPATEKTGAVSNKARYVTKDSPYPIDGSETYPNPTRANFTLEGWHIYGSDGEAHHIDPTKETVSANCHLVANWTGADEYKITHIGTGAIPAEQLSRPPISINHDWITAHVPAALTTTIEREKWLNAVGANGINNWQSYVLGLDPNDAKSLPYIKVNRNADDQHGVRGELRVDVGGVNLATGHTVRPFYHVEYATAIDEHGNLVNKTANTEQKASGSLTLPAPQPATGERPADHHVRYYSLGVSYQFLRSLEEAAAAAQLYATHDENQPCREHEDHNYIPTNLTNGDFETDPNEGLEWYGDSSKTGTTCPYRENKWNTTEVYSNVENQPFFEWKDANFVTTRYNANLKPAAYGEHVCEMNAQNAGMLYQDLVTHGGDVIEWRLRHAVRTSGPDDQSIRVEIGKPMVDAEGNVVPATGTGANITPNIVKDGSLAIFEAYADRTYTVKTGLNDTSTIAYGNNSTTRNLYLDMTKQQFRWYTAGGVYVVPQGQELTRFGFISATQDPTVRSLGNLLDNIEFFTLLGNLVAKEAADGSVVLTGYWGDTDPMNKLVVAIEVDGRTTKHAVDMMNARKDGNGYFHVTIPPELIGSAGSLTAYHEDYPETAVTVDLLPVSATAFNTPVFGMLRVDSNQAETIINVPWMEASDSTQNIKICDLVRASNLTEGDELLYYTGSTATNPGEAHTFGYKAWKLAIQDGVKYWAPYTIVSRAADGGTHVEVAAPDGSEQAVRGGALFVRRTGNLNEPIYLHGRLTMATGTSTVTAGTDLKNVAHTLLAPPTVQSPCDLNDSACCTMTGTPAEGDRILIPNSLGALSSYHYRNGKWGKLRAGGVHVPGAVIPVGQGAWYQSAGGSPTFTWKEKSATQAQ